MGLQWQSPNGGLFTSDMQGYFWQCLFWVITQAAPLLMIMFAASLVYLIIWLVRKAVTSANAEDGTYTNDFEEDD
jgi:uncharacterized membrane protein YjgN (DUF898 family)